MAIQGKTPEMVLMEKAITLHKSGLIDQVIPLYRQLLQDDPDNSILLSNYGAALLKRYEFKLAQSVLIRALQLNPGLADGWSNLGNFYQLSQDYGLAIEAYQKCLSLKPDHPEALSNLAMCLSTLGHYDIAQQLYRLSIELEDDNQQTRLNYAISLLASGNYKDGFRENEWRWTEEERKKLYPARPWNGENLEGKNLLILSEAGFGDMIQFSRFFPEMKKFGAHLIIVVPPELLTLFMTSFPEIDFRSRKDPLPDYDFYLLMISMPHVLGTELGTIPGSGGYLKADPRRIEFWQEELKKDQDKFPHQSGLRIGLVWSGSSHPEEKVAAFADRRRSMNLDVLAPLVRAVPDALFYSLQIGDKSEQALIPPPSMSLVDHTAKLCDFSETAALIMNLDLVISVDTSTAHLAAALGKPVLLLSRFDQCWRWLYGRQDTPWYKSMKIYQQERPFDWSVPLKDICHDLRQYKAGGFEKPSSFETRLRTC